MPHSIYNLIVYTDYTSSSNFYTEWLRARAAWWDGLFDSYTGNATRDFFRLGITKMIGRLPPDARSSTRSTQLFGHELYDTIIIVTTPAGLPERAQFIKDALYNPSRTNHPREGNQTRNSRGRQYYRELYLSQRQGPKGLSLPYSPADFQRQCEGSAQACRLR